MAGKKIQRKRIIGIVFLHTGQHLHLHVIFPVHGALSDFPRQRSDNLAKSPLQLIHPGRIDHLHHFFIIHRSCAWITQFPNGWFQIADELIPQVMGQRLGCGIHDPKDVVQRIVGQL